MFFSVSNGHLYNLDIFESFQIIDLHGSKAVVGYFRGGDKLVYIGTGLTEHQAKQTLEFIKDKIHSKNQYMGSFSTERRLFN